MNGDTAAANKDIDSAVAARAKLAKIASASGASPVVQIYTELYDKAALSYDFIVPGGFHDKTRAGHIKSLETTYIAIDLNKAKARLHAAQGAVIDVITNRLRLRSQGQCAKRFGRIDEDRWLVGLG